MSLNGCVKWFNSKKGYGFVTVITPDSEHVGTDIFAHFSNVNVSENNYKRLFPGEYVSFSLGKNNDRDVCIDISGIGGGRLLADHPEYRYKYFPKNRRTNEVDEVGEAVEDEAVEDEAVEDEAVEDDSQDPETSQ